MAGEFIRDSVGDYATLIRGTTYKGELVGKPGPALLGLGSIEPGGGFRHERFKSYGGDCPELLRLYPGDLYASLKGATKDGDMIGSVARVPQSVPVGRLTQDTVKLVLKSPSLGDASYLYWMLRTPQYREYCGGHATGSAVVALSRSDFLSYPIPTPTLERRLIVQLLDHIEARIELNRLHNQTLEAMACALFQDWFVDFGPVRAKMEGREPYLPTDLWQLFPDCLDDEGKPKGWDSARLDDALVLQRGFDLPASERTHGDHPVMAASGINGYHDKFMVKGPGVTTGRSGVLGRVFLIQTDFWPLNTSLWVKEFKRVSPHYAFELLRRLNFEMFNAGSAVPTLNRNHVHNLPITLPPKQLVDAFDKHAVPVAMKLKSNDEESETLVRLRDTLLPKLISGELRVKDAERIAEQIV